MQYDELYTGCHPVWGERLQMIAYWLVPGELLEMETNLSEVRCSTVTEKAESPFSVRAFSVIVKSSLSFPA